jgi:uncharacterized sulfatase
MHAKGACMKAALFFRLCLMRFLELFLSRAWWVTLRVSLGSSERLQCTMHKKGLLMRDLGFHLIGVVLIGLLATASSAQTANQNTDAEQPPNVVLLISDDQAWTDYSFMGHPHIETPNIDRLAEQSLTFTRGYVTTSLCRPSLMTIATGLYPRQHLTVGNDPMKPKGMGRGQARQNPVYQQRLAELLTHIDLLETLPRLLRQHHDYLAFQSGKWWEGSFKRGGFTHGMTEGYPNGWDESIHMDPDGRHGDQGLRIGREGLEPIYDFIDTAQAQDRPFFLWYAPFMPHSPHTPPQRLVDKYKADAESLAVARYWAMCEWFDETCGQLLDHLESEGLRENTIVIYVCDNGWVQDPDRPNRYATPSKRSVYDTGLRTPIMVRWPGHTASRMDRTTPVSNIDIAPTVLDAAGIEPTKRMHGVSLLDDQATEQRDAIYGAVYSHDMQALHRPLASLQHRWMIQGKWKLILPYFGNTPSGTVQLYNLDRDPGEDNNLADQHPERVASMRKAVNQWWQSIDEPKHRALFQN